MFPASITIIIYFKNTAIVKQDFSKKLKMIF